MLISDVFMKNPFRNAAVIGLWNSKFVRFIVYKQIMLISEVYSPNSDMTDVFMKNPFGNAVVNLMLL